MKTFMNSRGGETNCELGLLASSTVGVRATDEAEPAATVGATDEADPTNDDQSPRNAKKFVKNKSASMRK